MQEPYVASNLERMQKSASVQNQLEVQQEMQAFKAWHERARKVMYWLSISISDSMIVHIQDASTPKEAWDTLSKMYRTNMQARKMQLK